jgi:DNA-binding NarL/FixJ family response regulator
MGHKRIPPEIAQQIAEHAADDGITARELDVLRCVAKGSSNKIIASMLNISEQTVKHHVTSILSKLDASDRTHAVIIALQRGLLEM